MCLGRPIIAVPFQFSITPSSSLFPISQDSPRHEHTWRMQFHMLVLCIKRLVHARPLQLSIASPETPL
jgi:hypothetical protein